MYISCRSHVEGVWLMWTHVDVHTEEGVWLMWTHVARRRGSRIPFFCGRHIWMAPMGVNSNLNCQCY